MTVEQRIAAATQLSPEMCSLNMGSMNFAHLSRRPARIPEQWKRAWEEQVMCCSRDQTSSSATPFATSSAFSRLLGRPAWRRSSSADAYDAGHLYNLGPIAWTAGSFRPPFFVQLIFGILGGHRARNSTTCMFMKRTADKLFGDQYESSCWPAAGIRIPFATMATMIGGRRSWWPSWRREY